jgi:uncharacterized protein YuzE
MATVGAEMPGDFAGRCVALAMEMVKLPATRMWLDYDKEADVLYVSLRKPQRATDTVELTDDILLRKDGDDVVGLTILKASAK